MEDQPTSRNAFEVFDEMHSRKRLPEHYYKLDSFESQKLILENEPSALRLATEQSANSQKRRASTSIDPSNKRAKTADRTDVEVDLQQPADDADADVGNAQPSVMNAELLGLRRSVRQKTTETVAPAQCSAVETDRATSAKLPRIGDIQLWGDTGAFTVVGPPRKGARRYAPECAFGSVDALMKHMAIMDKEAIDESWERYVDEMTKGSNVSDGVKRQLITGIEDDDVPVVQSSVASSSHQIEGAATQVSSTLDVLDRLLYQLKARYEAEQNLLDEMDVVLKRLIHDDSG